MGVPVEQPQQGLAGCSLVCRRAEPRQNNVGDGTEPCSAAPLPASPSGCPAAPQLGNKNIKWQCNIKYHEESASHAFPNPQVLLF